MYRPGDFFNKQFGCSYDVFFRILSFLKYYIAFDQDFSTTYTRILPAQLIGYEYFKFGWVE